MSFSSSSCYYYYNRSPHAERENESVPEYRQQRAKKCRVVGLVSLNFQKSVVFVAVIN